MTMIPPYCERLKYNRRSVGRVGRTTGAPKRVNRDKRSAACLQFSHGRQTSTTMEDQG